MQARCGLNEADDMLVDRYFHGLRIDIQHLLTFRFFDNVNQIIQHAIKAEDIENYQAWKFNASRWVVQKNSSMRDSKPSGSSEKGFQQA